MNMKTSSLFRPLIASAAALALLAAPSAFAATRTWSGTTNGTWSTSTNWGAGPAPVAGDTIAFTGLNNVATTNDLAADTSFAGINFSGSNVATSGNFTLSGNRITLAGNITTTGTGVGGGILSDTIALDIVLSANSTISTGGAAAARVHNLTISGNISGGFGITKTAGAGTFGVLTLSGNNTFTGGVDLTSGTLKLGHASALGTGALTINAGSIDNSSGAALTLANNNPITINGNFTFTGTDNLNLGNGAVSLGSAAGTVRQITVSAGTLTVNGTISDGATATAITKLGTGILTFGGSNTFTGGINVNNGDIGAKDNNAWGTGVVTFAGGGIDTTNSLTIANDLVFANNVSTNALSQDMVYTGNVTGTGNFNFNGFSNGSTTFTGNNTGWSGNITLSGAQLRLGHVNAAGTGTINFAGNANTIMPSMSSSADLSAGNGVANNIVNNDAGTSFILDNNLKLSGIISGAGTTRLSSGSTGTLFLTGNNTYTGFTSIQASTLAVTDIGNGGDSRNIGASSNAATNLVIGGSSTTGTLLYTGAGETTDRLFTIGSASTSYNTSTGSGASPVVTLNATVTSRIDSSGTGALVFGNTGNLLVGNALNTVFELTGNNTDSNTIAAVIGNTATHAPINTTNGTTTSSTNGNPNKQIVVSDTTGIMVGDTITATGSTGNFTGNVTSTTVGAVLSSTRLSLVLGTLYTGTNATYSFTQPDVSLNKTSLLKSGAGTWVLSGTNTYTGNTTINGGALVVSSDANLGTAPGSATAGHLNLNDGALATTANMTLDSNRGIALGGTAGGQLNVASGTALTYGGIIAGSKGLEKAGTGTLNLSGNNSYTGATLVTAGTMVIESTGSIQSSSSTTVNGTLDVRSGGLAGAVSVNSGGSAIINGTAGALTIANGATLSGTGTITGATIISGAHNPGNSPGIQTFGSDLAYTGGNSTVTWELKDNTTTNAANPNAVFDTIVVGGNLDFTGATALTLSFTPSGGSSVLWANTFWDTSKTGTNGWLLYQVAGTTTNFANLTLNVADWLDSGSNAFNTARPGATFGTYQDGNNIYLTYTAVPEPAAWILAAFGLTTAVVFRRRRQD